MDPIVQFALVAVVALGASYIQSVTGFGFGIFAMIFLPHLLLQTEANVLSTMLSMLTSLFTALLLFRRIHWKNLLFPVLGCLVSTAAAVAFIKTQENDTLILLLGIALFALSVYFFFFSAKIRIKPTWYAGLIAGVLSGIMGGMFAIGGPPVVVYYMQSEKETDGYLATISAYFILSGVVSVASKAAAGFVTVNVWIGFAVGTAGMLLGAVLGKFTRAKIKPNALKRVVYAVMAVSGIVNVVLSLV